MKNKSLLKHILTSVTAVGALAFLFVISQSVIAQGVSQSSTGLYQDQGSVSQLQLAPKDSGLSGAIQSSLSSGAFFRIFGDTIFDDVTVSEDAEFNALNSDGSNKAQQNLNIGYPDLASVPGYARLQVDGNIHVSDLERTWDSNNYCVCANEFGSLEKCGVFNPSLGLLCENTPAAAYSWVTTSWGSCNGSTAGSCSGSYSGATSCTGTPSSPINTDWNNASFSWSSTGIYASSSLPSGPDNATPDIVCAVDNPSLAADSSCIGLVPPLPSTGSGVLSPGYYTVLPNPSNPSASGTWYEVSIAYGNCSESAGACGPMGGIPGSQVVTAFIISSGLGNAFGTCSATSQSSCEAFSGCTWGGANYSCAGASTGSACTSQDPACTWNPASSGTQTRIATCEDSAGATVADSFCTDPKPSETQSC